MSFNNHEERSRNNKGLSFVFRKTEKLTTALYMVTDIMSEREPIKWKMRETAVDLLSGVTAAMSVTPGEKMSALSDVLKKVDRMISFLEIAHASHMLSAMNASVLKKEYSVLKNSVEYEWAKIFDNSSATLTESFFHVPEDAKIELKGESRESKKSAFIGQTPNLETKRQPEYGLSVNRTPKVASVEVNTKVETSRTAPGTPSIQRHAPIQVHPERMHGMSAVKDAGREVINREISDDLLPERGRIDSGKSDRRTIILALIKQKPNLGVKDFVKSIPNVSEKTIQRELLAMVAEGVLVKKGERRWSTYSLPGQS